MKEQQENDNDMNYKIIDFQRHGDARGMLIAVEEGKEIPFKVKRVYYMYDTRSAVRRGCHAHIKLEQILICIHGSCKIHLDDGKNTDEILLDKPDVGLYISSAMWREMYDFSKDAVLLVLASELYDESDYIRDYNEFSRIYGGGGVILSYSYRMLPLETSLVHARRGFIGGDVDKPFGCSRVGMIGTIDGGIDVPFEIRRAFYIFNTDNTERAVVRGCHSNRKSKFALICLVGSCRVRVRKSENEQENETFLLNRPDKMLILSEMVWKEMYDFSENSVLLCLSSEKYDSAEYVRNFEEFLKYSNGVMTAPVQKTTFTDE